MWHEMYNTTDGQPLTGCSRGIGIRYIYVGQLERAVYRGGGLDKFGGSAQDGCS